MSSSELEFININEGSSPLREQSGAKPHIYPVLGLSDIVVFPGMIVPLLVESSSSIKLIDDVVAGNRMITLLLQKKTEVEDPLPEDLWKHGCLSRVLKMLKFPDNTVRVLVEGLRRVQVAKYTKRKPYLMASVRLLEDKTEESIEYSALLRNVQQQFQNVIALSPSLSEQAKIAAINAEDASQLSDLVAANLNLSLQERQTLLRTQRVKDRLARLLPILNREIEVLSLGSKIQKEVSSSMSKSQRDFFLREQMRAIQRELGEIDPAVSEMETLRFQIEKAGMPEYAQKVAFSELERLQNIPPAAAEYVVSRNYLDWLAHLPWTQCTEDQLDLRRAARILDEQHHGLAQVKDRLLEYLSVMRLTNSLKGPILCLAGPPGVGKTSLGQSVADALGRKFIRIALGGMHDEAEIRGHRRTYVGSLPGRIIQSLRRVESRNPVILLDEIDKVGANFRGDPSSALLEVLDPEQNKTFTDNYLDLSFDLSKVLFLTTANWLDPIHPALKDRLEIIDLPSYTLTEKMHIAKDHLLPRQMHLHGIKRRQVDIQTAAMHNLITQYTQEAGVRQLERGLASLLRKSARKIVAHPKSKAKIRITEDTLGKWLGAPKYEETVAENISDCGIAMGLAWTPVGGTILFIEATRMPGKGKLTLTGSLGDVMKESAQTALSFLRSQADKLKLDFSALDQMDLHIHVPEGATPKDGPSAGITLAVALASLFSQRPVKSGLAMTGEISLRGRVMPVGGVKEKALAAYRGGIKQLLIPESNRKEWNEIPVDVRKNMKVTFVSDLKKALQAALASPALN